MQTLGRNFEYFKTLYQSSLTKSKRMGNIYSKIAVFDQVSREKLPLFLIQIYFQKV
jgi:hypothetical protein